MIILLGTSSSCENDNELRYALAERSYQLGFIEGMIFTLDAASLFLAGTVTAEEIDIESEAMRVWKVSANPVLNDYCDSLGVVYDDSISNGLLGIYRMGFSTGIVEGERYVERTIINSDTTTSETQLDERQRAKLSFEANQEELLYLLDGVRIYKKQAIESVDTIP